METGVALSLGQVLQVHFNYTRAAKPERGREERWKKRDLVYEASWSSSSSSHSVQLAANDAITCSNVLRMRCSAPSCWGCLVEGTASRINLLSPPPPLVHLPMEFHGSLHNLVRRGPCPPYIYRNQLLQSMLFVNFLRLTVAKVLKIIKYLLFLNFYWINIIRSLKKKIEKVLS